MSGSQPRNAGTECTPSNQPFPLLAFSTQQSSTMPGSTGIRSYLRTKSTKLIRAASPSPRSTQPATGQAAGTSTTVGTSAVAGSGQNASSPMVNAIPAATPPILSSSPSHQVAASAQGSVTATTQRYPSLSRGLIVRSVYDTQVKAASFRILHSSMQSKSMSRNYQTTIGPSSNPRETSWIRCKPWTKTTVNPVYRGNSVAGSKKSCSVQSTSLAL